MNFYFFIVLKYEYNKFGYICNILIEFFMILLKGCFVINLCKDKEK